MVNLDILSESYQRVGMEPFEALSELDAPESEFGSELGYSRSSSPVHLSNDNGGTSTVNSAGGASAASSDIGASSELSTSAGEFSMPRMAFSGHTETFTNLTSSVRLARFPTLESDAIEQVRPSVPVNFKALKPDGHVDFRLYGADEAVARQVFEILMAKFSDVQLASNGIRLFWLDDGIVREFQSDGSFVDATSASRDSKETPARRAVNLYFYGALTSAGHDVFRNLHSDADTPWDEIPSIPLAYDYLDVDAHRCWDIRASTDAPLAQVEYKDGSSRFAPIPIRMLYAMDLKTFLVVKSPTVLLRSFESPEGASPSSVRVLKRKIRAKKLSLYNILAILAAGLVTLLCLLPPPQALISAGQELATQTGLYGPSTVTIYAPFKFHPDAQQVSDARWIHEVEVERPEGSSQPKHSFVELELPANDARILSAVSAVRSTAVTARSHIHDLTVHVFASLRSLYEQLRPIVEQLVADVVSGTKRGSRRVELFAREHGSRIRKNAKIAYLDAKYRLGDAIDENWPKAQAAAQVGKERATEFGAKAFASAQDLQHKFRKVVLGR